MAALYISVPCILCPSPGEGTPYNGPYGDVPPERHLFTFQVAKFMFYYHNQLLPSLFVNLFVTSGQLHIYNYGIRTVNSYRSHPCRTNLKQFTILYQGPKIWNSLPATITCSPSLPSFKKNTLGFLIKSDLV